MPLKIIFVVMVFSFISSVFADCTGFHCTNVKITRLYVKADGNTVISTSGDESNLSCTAGSSGYISLDPAASNYDSTYSLLLAAHLTESPIWVRTNETGSCQVVYVVSDR